MHRLLFSFFFFNDTATTEIYTLSLHDALPIYPKLSLPAAAIIPIYRSDGSGTNFLFSDYLSKSSPKLDRKSTRLNSSHSQISYAVFCLKKKKLLDTAYLHTPNNHTSVASRRTL